MDATHIHLIVNHIPILGTIFSVLILAWGVFRSEKSYRKLAMVGFIVAGVFSIIAVQSGEGAEEIIENMAGISESFIHDHEEAAEIANWIGIALAVLSGVGLTLPKFKPSLMKKYLWGLLIVGIISGGMFSYTAYLGGQIRHTEIRPDASVQQLDTGGEPALQEQNENDE